MVTVDNCVLDSEEERAGEENEGKRGEEKRGWEKAGNWGFS